MWVRWAVWPVNMVCVISLVAHKHDLYDIHCLVFILETDYMVSFVDAHIYLKRISKPLSLGIGVSNVYF